MLANSSQVKQLSNPVDLTRKSEGKKPKPFSEDVGIFSLIRNILSVNTSCAFMFRNPFHNYSLRSQDKNHHPLRLTFGQQPETGLKEVLTSGADLMAMAQNLQSARRTGRAPPGSLYALKLNMKKVFGLGLAFIGSAAAAPVLNQRWYQSPANQGSTDDCLQADSGYFFEHPWVVDSGSSEFNQEAQLPHAEAIWAEKAVSVTSATETDDVVIREKDFSCFTQRENLSLAQILRQVGQTLTNPVTKLAEESQVIHFYNRFHECPAEEDIKKLTAITLMVDKVTSAVVALIPGANNILVLQTVGGALFQFFADALEGKSSDSDLADEVNSQIIFMAKAIVETAPKGPDGKVNPEKIKLPENISWKNDRFSVPFKGAISEISHDGEGFLLKVNGRKHRAFYSREKNTWEILTDKRKSNPEYSNKFRHIKKLESRYIDDRFFFTSDKYRQCATINPHYFKFALPDKNGIYTYFDAVTKQQARAVKIEENFYRLRPGGGKGSFYIGERSDVEIMRFDDIYYEVNEKSETDYTPCRLRRAPGTSCSYLSSGLAEILESNKVKGIPVNEMRDLTADSTGSGFYKNARDKLFFKYHDMLFRLKRRRGNHPDESYDILGKKSQSLLKRLTGRKIAVLYVSRARGRPYFTTPMENMMESAGVSRETAESHIAMGYLASDTRLSHEVPPGLRETIKSISVKVLRDPAYTLYNPSAEETQAVSFFRKEATKLIDAASEYFELHYENDRESFARPDIPEPEAAVNPMSFIASLYAKTEGMVLGEFHASLASKKFLIENMKALHKAGVRTLYLEHLQSDMHQADLNHFYKTGRMTDNLKSFIQQLDYGHHTDPAEKFNFIKLVKAARRQNIRTIAIDSFISYYAESPHGSSIMNRVKIMNYYSHRVMVENRIKTPGKWIALVGNAHLGTLGHTPGIAELNQAVGIRVEDVAAGMPDEIVKDPGKLMFRGQGFLAAERARVIKGDLLLKIGTKPAE